MIIPYILEEINAANKPIVKLFHKHYDAKVIAIALKSGMVLKEHQAPVNGKLLCLKGRIVFMENNKRFEIGQFEEKDITAHIPHSIEALEESVCLVCL